MRKLMITPGDWHKGKEVDEALTHSVFSDEGYEICFLSATNPLSFRGEQEFNMDFIAEAGTVANETGLGPREMKEQRDRLLERLKITDRALKAGIEEYRFPPDSGLRIALEALIEYNEQAIADAEGRG